MNRIFISYRSSDGKKDAARLAADLNERFGEQLVFYDKQDLVGGASWRDAINATLGSQPVVLVLITPDLLGAPHPEGGRRIDREDDPIRGELLTARHSGAVIIPLLTDGMQMPAATCCRHRCSFSAKPMPARCVPTTGTPTCSASWTTSGRTASQRPPRRPPPSSRWCRPWAAHRPTACCAGSRSAAPPWQCWWRRCWALAC